MEAGLSFSSENPEVFLSSRDSTVTPFAGKERRGGGWGAVQVLRLILVGKYNFFKK